MWLSIQGIYEYDPTVFDGFDTPSYTDPDNVVHVLNKNDVINSICLECAELELLYPSVEMMKFAIGVWSASNYDAFCKMYATQLIKYNPIWNVDADETERTQHGKTETTTFGDTLKRTIDTTDEETIDTTSIESVQGFNSNSWSGSKKIENDGTDTFEHDGTDTLEHTGIDTLANTGIDTITKRRTGNIGVTASQDLIKKEREVSDFSTIEFITKSFKERFCLLVY